MRKSGLFQGEDGIRDLTVTGVQTCALPISRAPIRRLAPLIEHVPPARVFDEMLKLLLSGHASACVRQLREEGLSKGVLPLLYLISGSRRGGGSSRRGLGRTTPP